MAASRLDRMTRALAEERQPHIIAPVVEEDASSVVLQVGGCLLEIPKNAIRSRKTLAGSDHLTIDRDVEFIVSTAYSVKDGFLDDKVFADIPKSLCADNCNCNCNCNCDGNCNCNCNCNCDTECSVCTNAFAPGVGLVPLTFRKPFSRGGR
jgi:hypothetical protein